VNSSRSSAVWKRRISGEIRAAQKMLILAVGNPLRGDDAAGLFCAKKLKKYMRGKFRSRLKIVLGYESPENFTGTIRAFCPDFVLILDSALGAHKPGTVFSVDKEKVEDEGVSTHHPSLQMLSSYLEKTMRCRVAILGIQPLTLEPRTRLSVPVKNAACGLAAYLARTLCA
jgi:hydrogenase 3 maturation protease